MANNLKTGRIFFATMAVITIGLNLMSVSMVFAQDDGGIIPPPPGSREEGQNIILPNPLCPPGQPECSRGTVVGILDAILTALVWFSAPIAIIMVLLAAYKILFNADNPTKITEAYKQIMWVCVGLAIIIVSKSITSIVISLIEREGF